MSILVHRREQPELAARRIGEHVAVSADFAGGAPQAVVEAHRLAVLGVARGLGQRQGGGIVRGKPGSGTRGPPCTRARTAA